MLSMGELNAERQLIEASQADPRRFAELYERYVDRVYTFALARTHDRHRAEDVTAETFRLAIQNLSRFQWRGVPFSAWLFRIAANRAADLGRTRGETSLDDLPDEPAEAWEAPFMEVEQRVQLQELVRRLPDDQQRVILMRFAQDKSINQIAQAMRRSEGAIKQLQYRAVQTLREWTSESHD